MELLIDSSNDLGESVKESAAHWTAWGQYVAIAAAYEAIYAVTHYFSPPQFLLTTGLRLACMLLLPTRFWPALAIGEFVPLVENAIFCAKDFGVPWAILVSVPTVALWWPLLMPLRHRWAICEPDGRLRMPVILVATLCASVITSVMITVTWLAAFTYRPGKFPAHDPLEVAVFCLLGAYLGALTLTPVILALRERFFSARDVLTLKLIWRSALLRDVFWWVVPTLAALAWFAVQTNDDDLRQVTRVALMWPVLGLAWRHGWHGTAVGGMMASFALASTAHGTFDPEALKIQVVLAVVLSGALILGTRSHGVSVAEPRHG